MLTITRLVPVIIGVQVSGFVCVQLVDLSDPGEVLLEYWEGEGSVDVWVLGR